MVFDVKAPQKSWDLAMRWKAEVDRKVKIPGTEIPIPSILLANKIDLVPKGESWGKSAHEMDTLCEGLGFDHWAETSAKTGQGIDEAVTKLLRSVFESELKLKVTEVSEEAVNLEKTNGPGNNCLCSSQ